MTDTWEEEFDEKFGEVTFDCWDDFEMDYKELKSFIRTLIKQAKAERDEEWLKVIEGKKLMGIAKYGNMPAPYDPTYKEGYNQALDDLKSTIERKE